jgi:arylsulfatase
VKLPENDREGKPIIFDSFDMSPVLFGTGKSERKNWFYFTENELTIRRRARRKLQSGIQPAR